MVERQTIRCTEQEKAEAMSQLKKMEDERQKALARRAEAEAAASSAEDRAERTGLTKEQEDAINQAAIADMERSLREVLTHKTLALTLTLTWNARCERCLCIKPWP